MSLAPSWVPGAGDPEGPFPLNNLPYGAFVPEGDDLPRCCVAIGDCLFDACEAERDGLIDLGGPPVAALGEWSGLLRRGPGIWAAMRARLTDLLREDAPERESAARYLRPRAGARLGMPFAVAEFTDFYAGRHHATNVGTMFRGPENALPENWLSMPIGYNGRASSVVVSGTDVVRPHGQIAGEGGLPRFAPSARFDFELEMGAVVGTPSEEPVSVAEADAMIFGYVLLNDWSARDVQAWEYRPLGPFQAKATATTVSPWIVPAAALAPFRVPTPARERPLLPYLHEPGPMLHDVALEVGLAPEGRPETVIARTGMRELYYSPAQQLAHHTSSGCPMRTGDLLGTGTISGAARDARGSMLELSWGGEAPITLETGERRAFLEDGDTLALRCHAQGEGFRIGFGDCTGTVRPARDLPDWAKE